MDVGEASDNRHFSQSDSAVTIQEDRDATADRSTGVSNVPQRTTRASL